MAKKLTAEQLDYIRSSTDAIDYIASQLEQMGSYGEEREEQLRAIEKLKDFNTWTLRQLLNS